VSTIRGLVDRVTQVVANEGLDVSPHDVGHIVALFFEGLVHDPSFGVVNPVLQKIADECESVKDEG